jgi:succinate dehydrogenase / fumarate reductase, flavoprotein subunit
MAGAMQIRDHDALIVGAGGAGLWAASSWPRPAWTAAVLTKLYPTRSHTGAAQGGVCAALGNQEEDHWEWHMFDTIKGGDYLVDQDAAEVLAREAIETVIELEHMGLPFNRTPDGQDRPAAASAATPETSGRARSSGRASPPTGPAT